VSCSKQQHEVERVFSGATVRGRIGERADDPEQLDDRAGTMPVARRLFIAPGTVKVHLSHIFAKLGITTHAELAAQDLTVR
jgi:Bacterial regulatory proteins, luxR family